MGEPPGCFCDVGFCCCCCFLTHWRFFISLLFDVIFHSSVSYRQFFTPILYFQPSSSQSDSGHFHSFLPQVLRFWVGVFYQRAFFTLHSFVYDSDAGRNTPPKIFLCAGPHRIVPSGWHMDLNYWCLNHKTIDLSIAPVSHEV